MPRIITPTPDVSVSVTRPIVLAIVKDIIKRTGLDEHTYILFPDEVEGVRQFGSTIGEEDSSKFFNTQKVTVEAKETYDPTRIMATPVYFPKNKSIFSAPEVNTAIVPLYSRTEIEISLQFSTRDKTTAQRWRDNIRMKLSAGEREQTHVVDYNYMIPTSYIDALRIIHGMREKQAGYGESFDRWLQTNLSQKATIATDLAGKNPVWVIGERQIRLLGWFDFDTPEEFDRDSTPTHWTISVVYRAQYDKPIEQFMCYPIVIHNQVVPANYRSTPDMIETHDRPREYDVLTGNLAQFEAEIYRFALPGQGVRIPVWDEFVTENVLPKTVTLFTALTTITDIDQKTLLNIGELGDKSIESVILDFILKSEAPFIMYDRQSVFNLSVYAMDERIDPSRFTLANDGTVKAINDLSLRETYHVRLSVYIDWTLLTAEAIERLRQYPAVIIAQLQYLGFAKSDLNNGIISNRPVLLDLSAIEVAKTVTQRAMKTIVDSTGDCTTTEIGVDVNGKPQSYLIPDANRKIGFYTVGAFMVQANPDTAPSDPTDYDPTEK